MPRLLALLLLLAACVPARPTVVSVPAGNRLERPVPYPVFEPLAFARAIERGTRTRTGEPGPRYWQQWAEYRLAARLDPAATLLSGQGTVRYYNRSPDRLDSVAIHLTQNLHAAESPRARATQVTGGITLSRVVADEGVLEPFKMAGDAGAGYRIQGTIGWIRLPAPLAAGGSVDLEFAWSYPVPRRAPRNGQDGEVFHMAYWYPQLAVYDDVSGWQVDPYMANSEFYLGYGDYDVSLTVPEGWLVSATGTLQNPTEVLSDSVRARLGRAMRTRDVVHVVSESERMPGASTARAPEGADRMLTWHYKARQVRDVAWNASNKYVWDATHAVVPDADGDRAPDTVAIHSLYRPGTRTWEHAARYNQHSIEFLSRYLWPYPYPHMTAVEGIIGGGMEYPMMTLIGGNRDTLSLQSVTIHEIAHMWFPMIVGNDERRYAWMDEGLTNFNQMQGQADFFRGYAPDSFAFRDYTQWARGGGEVEIMRHGDMYPANASYAIATYRKPATALVMLRAILGEETFLRAFREYGRRWAYKHPQPYDLWNTFNQVSGRDLSWFWRTWFFETWTLDQAIAGVEPVGASLNVTIEDRGLAPMPVRLAVTREGGAVERVEIPVEVWLQGARRTSIRLPRGASIRRIEIDPDRVFADVDRTNQVWVRGE